MPVRQLLFGFKGRIRRAHWWAVHVCVFLVAALIAVSIMVVSVNLPTVSPGAKGGAQDISASFGFAVLMFAAAFLWASLALGVKRYHDIDRSGWWILLGFVPIANLWMMFELGVIKGTEGPNRYGPSSKAMNIEELRNTFS